MLSRIATTMVAAAALTAPSMALADAPGAGWGPIETVPGTVNLSSMSVNARGDAALGGTNRSAPFGPMAAFRPAGGQFGAFATTGEPQGWATVAVAPDGTVHASWVEVEVAGGGPKFRLRLASRAPDGAFAPSTVVATLYTSVATATAVADDGTLALAWVDGDGTGLNDLVHWVLRSADGALGATGSSGAGPGVSQAIAPTMAMNAAGDTVLAWTRKVNAGRVVEVVTRPAGGAFGTPVTLSDPTSDGTPPSVDVAPDGAAIVGWGSDDGSEQTAQAVTRPSASAPFGAPFDLSAPGTHGRRPAVAIGAGGLLVATWGTDETAHQMVALGTLSGGFGAPADYGYTFWDSSPRAAVAGDGTAIVTWSSGAGTMGVLRRPGEAFGDALTLVPGGSQGEVAFDAAGDALVTSSTGSGGAVARAYDTHGPELRGLTVPTTATAGAAAPFSVAPFDAMAGMATTSWDFGDGATADGADAQHAFAATGSYVVTVTATDLAGNATTATQTVEVKPAPVIAPPVPPVVPTPTPIVAPLATPKPPAALAPATPVVCNVPKLAGLTVAKAKAKLAAAHCRLGRVTTPKKLRKRKGLVVGTQSRKGASTAKAGAKVDVTLAAKAAKAKGAASRER
jgi:PKD domain